MLSRGTNPGHLQIAYIRHWLAVTIYKQRQYNEAEQIRRAVVEQQKRMLGAKHEDTLYSGCLLGGTLYERNKFEEATDVLRDVVPKQKKVIGTEHKNTLNNRHWLEHTLHQRNKFQEAEDVLRDVVLKQEEVFGTDHANTMRATVFCKTYVMFLRQLLKISLQPKQFRLQPPFTDTEISQVLRLLVQLNPPWSKIPRT